MNPILMLFAGAAYGYLAGNPPARIAVSKQMQRLSGMAIDTLNRQGEADVPTEEQPED